MNSTMTLALGGLFAVLGLSLVATLLLILKLSQVSRQRREQDEARSHAEARAANADARAVAAEQENHSLGRFRQIADAEQEAFRIRAAAHSEIEAARQHANSLVSAANQHAQSTTTQAEHHAQQLASRAQTDAQQVATAAERHSAQLVADARAQAARTLSEASRQAATTLTTAQQQAEATAGDALRALRNLEAIKREARALENVVEGYGDRYLVPTQSVLDDLAEEFGFAEAGIRLKASRERTRELLREGRAADCEYVEASRRETAIAFVADAFNGKVDSILSRVKEDNVGTLREKIMDSFALVNMNGRAFRDARITDEYLKSRLDELRWATAAQELKNREREEQRRIKEQIREEEKARKEFERAIRDAEKEEEAIKKAMEKMQLNVAKASDEQRARYEAQLTELQQKLQAAEEKNRRALSMAQQTKTGHVYVISNVGSFGEEVFKIGLTRRLEPLDRIRELGDASVPFEFDVHAMILSEDAPALEHALHRHFLASQVNKVNPRKEFFRVPIATIRSEIEKLGIQASWTMTAAAAEYRQSASIDKAIRENPAQYQAWLNKQLVLDAQIKSTDERDLAEAS